MRLIRIAIASLNTKVGALDAHVGRIVRFARLMADEGVTVGCFPEQAIGGYPAEDLVQWDAFVAAQWRALESIARATEDVPAVLALGLTAGWDGHLYNAAAVLHRGTILGLVPKEKLPTYGVFYEARTLSRGAPGLALDIGGVPLGDHIFSFDFGTLAVEVCEDAWTPDGPMRRRCFSGAEIVVNLSASPYRVGIDSTRREMLATRSSDNRAVLLYANQVGSQDGLVFDGGGLVFESGRLILAAPRFQEGLWHCVVDLDRTRRLRREDTTWRSDATAYLRDSPRVPVIASHASTGDRSDLPYPAPPSAGGFFLPGDVAQSRSPRDLLLDELIDVLSLGVADYFRKAASFSGIGIALSGGRDSLLTLLIAWLAARRADDEPDRSKIDIRAFYMPSRFSLDETRNAAYAICEEIGVPLIELPIDDAFDTETDATRSMLEGQEPDSITMQNMQARIRAARMWNWSNSANALFLQTGDMSEKAVGYTTIGGDLEGALSPIANVPKTVVIALLERLHQRFGLRAIRMTLDTEPGPELAADQTAENELMPFEILDACLHLYAGEKLSPHELANVLPALFPAVPATTLRACAERFVTLFTRSIYKWVQAPLSLHVGTLDLERERALQIPVVHDSDWDHDPTDMP
jgi:NAD+ synthase (glutamine-hydrolysing)